jgi:hypothetical protein
MAEGAFDLYADIVAGPDIRGKMRRPYWLMPQMSMSIRPPGAVKVPLAGGRECRAMAKFDASKGRRAGHVLLMARGRHRKHADQWYRRNGRCCQN